MKRSLKLKFLGLSLCFLFPGLVLAQSSKPQAAVAPISVIGNIEDSEKQILLNRMENTLSFNYSLISQAEFKKAQDAAFQQLNAEECTDEQCVRKIQEILQVERLFALQVIRYKEETQLALHFNLLNERKVMEELCSNCDTKDLYAKLDSLIAKMVSQEHATVAIMPTAKQPVVSLKVTPEDNSNPLGVIINALNKHERKSIQAGELVNVYVATYGLPHLLSNLNLNPSNAYRMAMIYHAGLGLPKDLSQAAYWYQKAAEQGHALAQNNLGFLYRNGLGLNRNFGLAAHWYRKASDQNNAQALYNLASLYQKGDGVNQDDLEALNLYRSAAKLGHSNAAKVAEHLSKKLAKN